ncbi:MAG: hypothetical protein GTN68_21290 [Candidatus Aminicenantes bacterium]|nr:hypothetical protein [Candidatus Aminicenantes bacterium]NIQ69015.1 hypothetical protein [Candidatus Aminicenantes bacterium]
MINLPVSFFSILIEGKNSSLSLQRAGKCDNATGKWNNVTGKCHYVTGKWSNVTGNYHKVTGKWNKVTGKYNNVTVK